MRKLSGEYTASYIVGEGVGGKTFEDLEVASEELIYRIVWRREYFMTEKYIENEQWKHGGLCNKCRRSNYCSTECKVHKQRVKYNMRKLVAQKLEGMTGIPAGKIMTLPLHGKMQD